jgi:hypothetical protein
MQHWWWRRNVHEAVVELCCRIKLKYMEKNLGSATLSTTNPTCNGLGLKSCLQRGWWLTTYRTAWSYFTLHIFTRKQSLSTLWHNAVESREWGNRHRLSAIQLFLCEDCDTLIFSHFFKVLTNWLFHNNHLILVFCHTCHLLHFFKMLFC